MTEVTSFLERLLSVIGAEKPFSWAARHEIAKSSIHNAIKLGRPPGPDQLVRISQAAGVTIDWLLTGQDYPTALKGTEVKDKHSADGSLVWLPILVEDEDSLQDACLAIDKKIVETLRAENSSIAIAYQQGDSMEPTISEGDLLLIDKSVCQCLADGVYLINCDGVRMAKRLQKKMDGRVVVQNDNAKYKSQTVSLETLGGTILGRVVMVFHKL